MLRRSRSPAVLSLLLAACSPATADGGFPSAAERAAQAVTVEVVARSADDLVFTDISGLGVDGRGRIYVADPFATSLPVLGPDGTLVDSLGRRGSGPGEFRMLSNLQVLPGDSLQVWDARQSRVIVFPPDAGATAHTRTLAAENGIPTRVWRLPGRDAYLAHHRPPVRFDGGGGPRIDRLRLLDARGGIRSEVAAFPSRGFLIAGTSLTPNPFGAEGLFAHDSRGRLHMVWSDSAVVRSYDADGTLIGTFSLPVERQPVRRSDRAAVLDDLGDGAALFASALTDSTPPDWPAVAGLLVDDRDHLWIALSGPREAAIEWVRVSGEGAYLGSVRLAPGTRLHAVHGGLLYASRRDENDVPYVVVLRPGPPLE